MLFIKLQPFAPKINYKYQCHIHRATSPVKIDGIMGEQAWKDKHGSWLNMAEIELNVLMGQCLNRRIDNIETMKKEVQAWQAHRNNKETKIKWRFTCEGARVKLLKLYPSINA